MNALEAFKMVNSWKRVLIEGNPKNVDQMLEDIERRFKEKCWGRNAEMEKERPRQTGRNNRWFCFVGGPQHGPQLLFCLSRISDRKVRGGTFGLLERPADMLPTAVAAVEDEIMSNILTPAADGLGLKKTIPRLGENSRVSPRTLTQLLIFSDLAAGVWPLPAELEPLWRRFVITACQEDTAFDIEELTEWFFTNGWSSEAAEELTERFLSEATLISEYEDATSS